MCLCKCTLFLLNTFLITCGGNHIISKQNSFSLSENEKRSFSIKVYFVQMAIKNLPIISNETVRCSLPEAFIAPRTVPTTEQHIPTNAIITMNHRMETV